MGMKKAVSFLLCVLLLLALAAFAAAERAIPKALRVTQQIDSMRLNGYRVVTYSVLHSSRDDVNEAINARVAALREEAEPLVPRGKDFRSKPARADICTHITRAGSRLMSFHICAQISAKNNQLWVKSEEYTYDMESGRLILLGEIVREDGWPRLLAEIRRQLESSFSGTVPNGEALDALCLRENLEGAGFVITPGHLALYFPAGDVFPAHAEALLRVEIYVPELWEILTDEMRQEMDCTGYEMVAMTYDDGPAKGTTRGVLNASVRHPGQVTFFLSGHRMMKNAELIHLEYDAGHSVQSHSWAHATKNVTSEKLFDWEALFDSTMGDIIGTVPVMMRPPGGNAYIYIAAGSRLPMILWNANSMDASDSGGDGNLLTCFGSVFKAKDGDVVLCHDVKVFAGDLAEKCMARFEENNVLLVTVNDLCALRGVPLEAGLILKTCPPDGE